MKSGFDAAGIPRQPFGEQDRLFADDERGFDAAQRPRTPAPIMGTDDRGLLFGTAEQIAEQVLERRERFGFSYVCVREACVDECGAIVRALRG